MQESYYQISGYFEVLVEAVLSYVLVERDLEYLSACARTRGTYPNDCYRYADY